MKNILLLDFICLDTHQLLCQCFRSEMSFKAIVLFQHQAFYNLKYLLLQAKILCARRMTFAHSFFVFFNLSYSHMVTPLNYW